MKQLSYLNKYLWKYRYRVLIGFLFVTLANVFAVLAPIVVRFAVDLVVENVAFYKLYEGLELQKDLKGFFTKSLIIFAGIFLALALLRGLFMFLMRQTIIVVSRLVEFDLRNELYAHYQKLDQAFYKRNNTGDLMNRIVEDVNRVRMYLGPGLMYTVNLSVLIVMVVSIMFIVNWQLTLFVLIPLPFLSISIFYVNNLIHKSSERIQEKLSDLTTHSQETFSGIRVIKSYVQEKPILKFFTEESEEYKQRALHLARIEALFFPLMMLLIGLSNIITIYVGGIYVIKGMITPGNIAEFVIYVNMLTWPVTSIGWVASIIQRAAASQKRINEFLHTEPSIQSITSNRVALEGQVTFRNVSFTYPDTGIEALRSVDFEIPPGQRWAVIGRTGCGKSTIAELMMRLYDVTEGEIQYDGQDARYLNLFDLRSQIGYVPQDVFLFSDSIYGNISFGSAEIDKDRAERSAEYASIKNEIEEFPEGFETFVGERGVTLSGGQKQRVSIARAFNKDSRILILDDCLSAVDANTEQRILQAFDELLVDRTSLIITHRIFALLNFDQILVMDEGRIVDRGTHEELLSREGLYKDLYEKQQMEEAQSKTS